MSRYTLNISFPLDDDNFLRRECPLCHKELKIQIEEKELIDLIQKSINSFLIETTEEGDAEQDKDLEIEFTCPYCGQQSLDEIWWTKEQHAYIEVYASNIMAQIVNKNLIDPLKRNFRGSNSGAISMRFEGKEMEQQEPWISPEVNDMEVFDLPCCQRKMKIDENWIKTVYCFFCGFPYKK